MGILFHANTKPPPGILPNRDHPLHQGLIGYWLFNEGGGSRVMDLSGFGHHGDFTNFTLNGDWRTGRAGGALNFGSTRKIILPNRDIFNGINPISYVFWVRPSALSSSDQILTKGASGSFHISRYIFTDTRFGFIVDGSTNLHRYSAFNTFTTDEWQHAAVTWDGSTTAANVHIYRNGIETSYSVTTDGASLSDDSSHVNLIGNRGDDTRGYEGLLSSFMIYNRVLSIDEIGQLYYNDLSLFFDPSPVWLTTIVAGAAIGRVSRRNLVGREIHPGWLKW